MVFLLFFLAFSGFASATEYLPFSWSNCGSASAPINVQSVTVAPSPIVFGQNITVSAQVSIKTALTNQTAGHVKFEIYKHIGFWVPIPCATIPGGCDYPNFCELGRVNYNSTICHVLKKLNIPCGCPINPGTYSVTNLSEGPVPVPPPAFSFLIDGSFKVHVELYDNNGNQLMCADVIDSAKQ